MGSWMVMGDKTNASRATPWRTQCSQPSYYNNDWWSSDLHGGGALLSKLLGCVASCERQILCLLGTGPRVYGLLLFASHLSWWHMLQFPRQCISKSAVTLASPGEDCKHHSCHSSVAIQALELNLDFNDSLYTSKVNRGQTEYHGLSQNQLDACKNIRGTERGKRHASEPGADLQWSNSMTLSTLIFSDFSICLLCCWWCEIKGWWPSSGNLP